MPNKLADDFHTQNQFLQNLMDRYSTNDTKSVYLNEQMETLMNINWWLFWIFILVGILFSIFIFISPKSDGIIMSFLRYLSPKTNSWSTFWSIIIKIIIVLHVFLYPYYIYPSEQYTLNWVVYIKDMIIGNPYVVPDF